jgi:[histone H3]-lysine36 N-trimethyltransferase
MSNGEGDVRDPRLVEDVRKMTVQDEGGAHNGSFPRSDSPTPEPRRKFKNRSTSHSPVKKESGANTPVSLDIHEATIGGEVTLKMEPGKMPKLSRTSSQKVMARPPSLFTDEPDMYDKATRLFQVITNCEYANKSLGLTEDEGLDEVQCECDDEWGESVTVYFVSISFG